MNVNAETKIGTILKEAPAALDAIVSLNPKFEKLRNPLLRKLMAGRTSIRMASKISGNALEEFYSILKPLGFTITNSESEVPTEKIPKLPAFFGSLKEDQIVEMDVRPMIEADADPLPKIIKKVKEIKPGNVLKIINTFEPTPLISLLKKQGFESFVNEIDNNLVETYFYNDSGSFKDIHEEENVKQDWDFLIKKYADKTQTIDVRQLQMPQPMMEILDSLHHLPEGNALFVYHKRIPVFLLPELREKGFDYRVKEIADDQVHLLIFKD